MHRHNLPSGNGVSKFRDPELSCFPASLRSSTDQVPMKENSLLSVLSCSIRYLPSLSFLFHLPCRLYIRKRLSMMPASPGFGVATFPAIRYCPNHQAAKRRLLYHSVQLYWDGHDCLQL